MSLSFSFSLSVCLSFYLSLSLSMHSCLSTWLSLPVSLSDSMFVSLPVFLSISIFIFLYHSFCSSFISPYVHSFSTSNFLHVGINFDRNYFWMELNELSVFWMHCMVIFWNTEANSPQYIVDFADLLFLPLKIFSTVSINGFSTLFFVFQRVEYIVGGVRLWKRTTLVREYSM